MPKITDKQGNEYEYQTLAEHGESICLNGDLFLNGRLSDFVIEGVHVPALVSVRAFRKRFTQVERVGLDLASIDNPSGGDDARATAASIRDFIKESDSAQFIDLNDDDTRFGVQYLESIGLITSGRALEILDAPVQEAERP